MALHLATYFGVRFQPPDRISSTHCRAAVLSPWLVSLETRSPEPKDELTAQTNSRVKGRSHKSVERSAHFSPRSMPAPVGQPVLPAPSTSPTAARPQSAIVSPATETNDQNSEGKSGTGSTSMGFGLAHSEGERSTLNLSRTPQLVSESYRCGDLFPYDANSDHGIVVVEIDVGKDGRSTETRVASAHPSNQGFDRAALACGRRLRFAPAINAAGRSVRGQATIKLRFSRGP